MTSPLLYIAGMGMITPLGPSVATTVAAVNAGISAYTLSEYNNDDGEPIIMARVPDAVFEHIECTLSEEGSVFNFRHERMIRLAIMAINEAVNTQQCDGAVPFVLGLAEESGNTERYTPFMPALAHNLKPWISLALTRRICTGRTAGIEVVDFAFRYLMNQPQDYVLLSAVDSFEDAAVLNKYKNRLLSHGTADAFAPGEGACALLLTRHIELAEQKNGYVIAINPPAMTEETGHLFSEKPYKGDGLDQAFKRALQNQPANSIEAIYSSMNGENHWAKEYGVAYLRNKEKFVEKFKIEHPADCYGDLGSATGTALIIAAAENLHKFTSAKKYLVYSSSDKSMRGALVVEKIKMNNQG
jgi:3-oxoacyl-[acyl-carrier-protein] synthase I